MGCTHARAWTLSARAAATGQLHPESALKQEEERKHVGSGEDIVEDE